MARHDCACSEEGLCGTHYDLWIRPLVDEVLALRADVERLQEAADDAYGQGRYDAFESMPDA